MIMRIYDGGGVTNALQTGADSAAWIALAAAPEVIPTGDNENIVLWPMNSTAAQTCTLALWMHTAAVGTLATIDRMVGVTWGAATDQTITTDRVSWGLATAVEYKAKGLACIAVTPNTYISVTVGASLGGTWYLRYSLGNAPLANFYD